MSRAVRSQCDRKIHEIEATGAVLPFNSKNGWSDFLR